MSRPEIQKLLDLPRIPGKTVYVLGAGFSYPLGVPLMSDFIPKGLDLLKQAAGTQDRHWAFINQVMELVNRCRRTLGDLADHDPDLQDIFSYIDLVKGPKSEDRKNLVKFIARVCHTTAKNWHECFVPRAHFDSASKIRIPAPNPVPAPNKVKTGVDLYYAFISQLLGKKPKHLPPELQGGEDKGGYGRSAIVSLNYDLVVETKVKEMEIGFEKVDSKSRVREGSRGNEEAPVNWKAFYGCGVVESESWNQKPKDNMNQFPLIKIHGSIDWRLKEGSECVLEERPKDIRGLACPLIYPSWQRDQVKGTVFGKLIEEARIHLRLAEKIVFVGYSMPVSDQHIRYLLADALDTAEPPKIETANLWKTDEEARTQIGAMMGARAVRCFTKNHPEGLLGLVTSWKHQSSVPTEDSNS